MRYPIVRLWWEARIVRERQMERIALEATTFHAAMTSIVESSFSKKGSKRTANKNFQSLLKRLTDGEAS